MLWSIQAIVLYMLYMGMSMNMLHAQSSLPAARMQNADRPVTQSLTVRLT
jgi:hypothetical protein